MQKLSRQDAIVEEIMRSGTLSVSDLADRLGVSEVTIRRDLDELDRSDRVQRVRGGVKRLTPRYPEPSAVQRQLVQSAQKRAIGLAASEMVADGDVIGLHQGTTVLELARVLAERSWQNLQVVTNGFNIVEALIHAPGIQLFFVGGMVSWEEMGTFGLSTQETMRRIRLDKLFIGCRGFDPCVGTSHEMDWERAVMTERSFATSAQRVIVLADSSKFGQVFAVQSIPIADVDVLVTDEGATEVVVNDLCAQDIKVVMAPLSGDGESAVRSAGD